MTEPTKEQLTAAGVRTADIYLCATCGSLSLELPALIDGIATCNGCGWKGPTRDLVVQSFQHTQGGDEELVRTFMREFRLTLARDFSRPLGVLLYKWGFLGESEQDGQKVVNPEHLKKYLTGVFHAGTRAIIETRAELEKERVSGRSD